MRKFQVLIWAQDASPAFFARLREQALALSSTDGVSAVQLNLADSDVEPAADKRMANGDSPLFDAVCSFCWQAQSQPDTVLSMLASVGGRLACYEVDAAEPLPNTACPAAPGERTEGFSQVALLRCPSFLSYEEWLSYWKTTHTGVAIETQSTFRYVQNRVVARPAEALPYDAIVEECFPTAAMTSSEAFYDAEGQAELFQQRLQAMMESCGKFIDFSEIEVVPTSEYCF